MVIQSSKRRKNARSPAAAVWQTQLCLPYTDVCQLTRALGQHVLYSRGLSKHPLLSLTDGSTTAQLFNDMLKSMNQLQSFPIASIVMTVGTSWFRPKCVYWMDVVSKEQGAVELNSRQQHSLSSRLIRQILQTESQLEEAQHINPSPSDRLFLSIAIPVDSHPSANSYLEQSRVSDMVLRREGMSWDTLKIKKGVKYAGRIRICTKDDTTEFTDHPSLVWLSMRATVKASCR